MNPLGFCSISALDRPLGAAAELAASLGLGLELTARTPHLEMGASDAAVAEAARAVSASGAPLLAYGSYLGYAPHTTPDHARREADVALALGAPRLRVWAESAVGDFDEVVAMLRGACDVSDELDVVVERHIGSWADTPERTEQLLDATERENLALNYQVLDLLPEAAAGEQAADARRLVPLARYFHLKNYRPNPDGGPLLPGGSLGGGVLDYRAILGAALGAGYTGPLAIEFLAFDPRPPEKKLAEDLDTLRELLEELGA